MQVEDNKLSSLKSYYDRIIAATDTPEEEYRPIWRMLVCDLMGLSATAVLLAQDQRLSESEILRMISAIKQLRAGIPIQYIIGHTEFYGLQISCDERALIPRPETEELVKWVLDDAQTPKTLLDIGTGSGCIALALASKLLKTEVHAMDLSRDALKLAQSNAEQLQLSLKWHEDSILTPQGDYPQYDLIVSNPPYVRDQEQPLMHERVLAHEPHLALFVPDEDALRFYEAICLFAKRHLNNGGKLYFEINEYLAEEMRKLILEQGFKDLEVRKDLYGKDRMLRATWNG